MTHLVEIACLTCIEVSGLPGWSCLLFLLPIDAGGAFETIRDRFIKTKNGKPGIDVIVGYGELSGTVIAHRFPFFVREYHPKPSHKAS
jgi:hypothetical protein